MARYIENAAMDYSRDADVPRVCDGSDADGTRPDTDHLPIQDVGPQGDVTRINAWRALSDIRIKGRAALIRAYAMRDMARQSGTLSAKIRYLQRAMSDMRLARDYMQSRVRLIKILGA